MRSLVVALLTLTTAANAYELTRDSAGEPAAWKSPPRFIVEEHLGTALGAEASETAVRAAVETLNAAIPGLNATVTAGKTRGVGYDFEHPNSSTSDVVAPADWKWNDDAVATTVVTVSLEKHEIIEADIAFNVRHIQFSAVEPDAHGNNRYDVQNAMTHELGHALGLAHSKVPGTVMFAKSAPGEVSKRTLAPDDLAGLKFLYAPRAPAVEEPVAAAGCNASGSAPFALVALMMVAVLLRRRRVFLTVAAVVGALLFVAPGFASQSPGELWSVSSVTTVSPAPGLVVLESDVTLTRNGTTHTVRIPGGRWRGLEQIVDGSFIPRPGDQLINVSR